MDGTNEIERELPFLIELTDQLAIEDFILDSLNFEKKKFDIFHFIIMRINPTTSGPGVSALEKKKLGQIAQIIGPVLDVAFPPGKMPNIYNALVVKGRDTVGQPINVTCEVQPY